MEGDFDFWLRRGFVIFRILRSKIFFWELNFFVAVLCNNSLSADVQVGAFLHPRQNQPTLREKKETAF